MRAADIWCRDHWSALGILFVVVTTKKIVLCGVVIIVCSERYTPPMTEVGETLHFFFFLLCLQDFYVVRVAFLMLDFIQAFSCCL